MSEKSEDRRKAPQRAMFGTGGLGHDGFNAGIRCRTMSVRGVQSHA